MKNLFFQHIGILSLLLILAGASRVGATQLDIAPLFTGYEKGCAISGTMANHLIVWASPDEKGHLPSIKTLPLIWQNHLGKSNVTDQVDHWFVKVPLQEINFNGVRVSRLERWYGKSNGISGWALVLAVPLAKAQQYINEKKFEFDVDGNFKPELLSVPASQETKLVCDVSM